MSLKTWKKEFYPIDADETTKKEAAAHSLRKWKGLTKENLRKHGLYRDMTTLREAGREGASPYDADGELTFFPIDADTCALCNHFMFVDDGDESTTLCAACPLAKVLGGKPCDKGPSSPYMTYEHSGRPAKMINALEKTVALCKTAAWRKKL